MRRALLLSLVLTGCASKGDPQQGVIDPCLTPQAALLGCPPATPSGDFTIEDACQKLVDCGAIAIDQTNQNGDHFGDFLSCTRELRGNDFSADRLHFTLHCVEVTTCPDLSGGLGSPCFTFGGEP